MKPAKSVDVTFTEELITRLKGDAPNGDALPLLAFTLEKLFRQCASDQVIELSEYEQLGGMTGAISQAVARILPKDMPKETEHALRMSFVKHLAQVNEKDEFVRRPARWSDLPAAAKPLLEEFVRRERLLQRSGHKGELVEVTHEAIFRCWDQLKKWLQDDLPALRLRRRVETLAEEWHCSRSEANPKGDDGLLLTLAQVAALNEWLNQGDVILSDGENTFVEASREKRKSDEQREIERLHQLADAQTEKARKAEARRQAEVARAEDARAAARNQKRLTLWAFSAAAIAVSLFAVAVWLRHIANHERSIAVTARDDARQEALIANVHRLAAQAAALGDEFPQRRVLLAAEAARRSLQAKIPIPEAEQALRDGLSRIGGHPLRGHSKDISLLKFSSNSHWLVTGSEDHNAILWDVRNRPRDGSSVQFMLPGHAGTLSAATFSPDGRWLATIAKDEPDSTVRVWDIIALNSDGGTHPIVTLDHRGYVRVFFTPDSRSLITLDRRELENGEGDFEIRKCTFSPAPTGEIRSMRFTMRDERMTAAEVSSDNHWLAAATTGNQIAVWNLADVDNQVSPQWVLSAESPSQDILFSPESRWLCVGSNTGEARLWELAKTTTDTRKAHRVLTAAQKVAQKTTRPVVFSPDNHWLVTETENSAAYIWDLSRLDTPLAATVSVEFIPFTVGSVVRRYYGLNKAEFSNDGRWLLTKDGSAAILWELHKLVADYSYLPVVLPGRQSLSKVSISHDSRWLVGASAVFVFGGASRVDTPVYLWDLKLLAANPSAEPLTLRGNEGGFMSEVAFSPDSRWLVTGALDGSVRLWDMREPGSPVQPLSVRSHTGEVNAITVTSNGKWLITGGGWLDRKIVDNTIRIWDLPALCKGNSPQPIVLSENEGAVNGLLVSASNRWVVGTGFRSARLWNLEQLIAGERSASRVVPVDGQLEAAAISDDERWFVLALSGLDKPSRLLVWPLVELVNSDNVAPVSLETHAGNIKEIIIDPSSRWLVISKGGSSGMAWNLNEFSSDPKRGQHMLSEQKGEVNCARFTRDGKLLITGHEDGNVRIWKVNDLGNAAVQPQTLKTSSRSVSQMSVSPDGRWLVVAANESFKVLRPRLLLWDMATLAEEGSPEPVLLEGHERHIQEMIVSSDSHWLVTASADATVRVWDLRNPRSASIVLDNSSKPLVMTPENRWLVTGGPDESFRLWNMDVSELIDVAEQSAGRKLGSEERQRYQIPETSP